MAFSIRITGADKVITDQPVVEVKLNTPGSIFLHVWLVDDRVPHLPMSAVSWIAYEVTPEPSVFVQSPVSGDDFMHTSVASVKQEIKALGETRSSFACIRYATHRRLQNAPSLSVQINAVFFHSPRGGGHVVRLGY